MAYNRATETTLEGTVDDVMNVPGTHAMSGTHLALNTKGETIHVHLGPSKFLEDQKISFAKGDRVKVTGSRVKGEGFEAILARTVTKENEVVKLRDEHGVPLWAAQGK